MGQKWGKTVRQTMPFNALYAFMHLCIYASRQQRAFQPENTGI
jgi:hypothetical protein